MGGGLAGVTAQVAVNQELAQTPLPLAEGARVLGIAHKTVVKEMGDGLAGVTAQVAVNQEAVQTPLLPVVEVVVRDPTLSIVGM